MLSLIHRPPVARLACTPGGHDLAESSYVLKIQYIQKPAETRTISASVITIGRDQGDIVLGDAQASGRHAEIRLANRKVTIHDLGSTNGVLIDGVRYQDAELQPGQTFVCGQTVMTILAIHGARQQVGGGRTMIAMGAPPGLGLPPPGLGMPPMGGLPQRGMPPQGAGPQGMPPQGAGPQGMPPQGAGPQG
ncbi:MAG TPA: FHA domain-containing protein, partial [Nannocystis exedens]|nr:FHA domain-containing protein [Nannocystis exedens]